jgi:hypothetical protein
MVWIEHTQDVPVFIIVIMAAVTGNPGGCALTVQLSYEYYDQGRIKRDIL